MHLPGVVKATYSMILILIGHLAQCKDGKKYGSVYSVSV